MPSRPKSVRVILLICLLTLAVLAAASCTSTGGSAGAGGSAGGGTAAVPDTAKAVEASIVASDGGTVGLKTSEAVVRVTFPLEVLAKDTAIVITPYSTAPGQDDKTLFKGFLLEERGTGTGPALSSPAYVEMIVAKELPDGAALVSYKPDGTFEVLPTRLKVGKGVTAVFALAPHFSPVTMRNVGKDAASKARDKFSDFNWVVYINDKQTGTNGPLTQSITLTLRAVNTGGDIAGNYTGNATIVSTNEGTMGGRKVTSPQTGKSDSVKITLTDGDPLAPVTPQDPLAPLTEDPLAPLTPADLPSWWGTGSITMSAMAVGGSAGVEGAGSTGVGNTSSLPVTLAVTGTQVSLTVSGLPPGQMTFKGFVRGEGKK